MLFRVKDPNGRAGRLLSDFLNANKFERVSAVEGGWEWWRDPSAVQSRKKIDAALRRFVGEYPGAKF